MKTQNVNATGKYITDSMRRIKDKDSGEMRVARMQEERAISVTLVTTDDKRVFHNGARIA